MKLFRFLIGIFVAAIFLSVAKVDFIPVEKKIHGNGEVINHEAGLEQSKLKEADLHPAILDFLKKESRVYSADIEGGIIGVDEKFPVDDPFDNVFHFFLEQAPSQNETVWLQYQLYGVQDHTAVSRGINTRHTVGGYLVKKTEEWTPQKERIDPAWLRAGDNVIRFSNPAEASYIYKIKDIQIVVENEGEENLYSEMGMIVNQPNLNYFNDQGYVKGFITGDQSGSARLFVENQEIEIVNGEFECIIDSPIEKAGSWQSELLIQFPDGEERRTIVYFSNPQLPDWMHVMAPKQGAYAHLFGPEGGEMEIPAARITIPDGALEEEKVIKMIPLRDVDLPALEPDMVNVTKNQAGFRFLPDGMQFAAGVSIELEYDPSLIPQGYTANDIRTYFFEERARRWMVLNRDTLNDITHSVVSSTTHFTDYINGIIKVPEAPRTNAYTPTSIKDLKAADPSAGVIPIEPPVANNMGSANLQFPLKLPAGRQGMQPQVILRYNSNGDNGWTGLGWDCSFSSIGIETRWGVPRYDKDLETETYTLDGMQLMPVAHRTEFEPRTTEKQFYPRVESNFQKIIRHGTSPKNYYWEVIDKDGTKHFYGGSESGFDKDAVLRDEDGTKNVAFWALRESRDLNDNYIRYHYKVVNDPGVPGGSVSGYQIYLERISYTGIGKTEGKYKVRFVRDRELGESPRIDKSINARLGFKQVTADLLRKIEITYDDQIIRSYELEYEEGAFYKTLLKSVNEKDKNGEVFYGQSFEYYDEVRQNNKYLPYNEEDPWVVPKSDTLEGQIDNAKQNFDGRTTVLGGSKSYFSNTGGAATIGAPILLGLKELSIGVNWSSGDSGSEGIVTLMDINGDNLPDKLYRKGEELKFQPNLSGATQGLKKFGTAQPVSGIDQFSQSNSYSSSFGWEASAFVFYGQSDAESQSEVSTYMADFNGDGLIDIAKDNLVYFNWVHDNGDVEFIPQSNPTPNPIIAGSALEATLIEIDPMAQDKLIQKYPLHDVVRVWEAPYSGTITITDSIQRIQPTTSAGINYPKRDELKYSLEVNNELIWSKIIGPDDFSSIYGYEKTIQVDSGALVFFRLQSVFNGAYDELYTDPEIKYDSVFISDSEFESSGLQANRFKASEDFLVASSQRITLPYDGEIVVAGDFVKPQTSDSLTLEVILTTEDGDTIVFDPGFAWDATTTFELNDTISVDSANDIRFRIKSNTNVEWSDLEFIPEVYYISAISNGDTLEMLDSMGNPKFVFYSAVEYAMKNQVIRRSESFTNSGYDILEVSPSVASVFFPPNGIFTDSFTVSAKGINTFFGEKNYGFSYDNGSVLFFGDPFLISVEPNEQVFIEIHFENKDLINFVKFNASVSGIAPSSFVVGLFTKLEDEELRFGPLFRGWGQFVYNGNEPWGSDLIDPDSLILDPAFDDPPEPPFNFSSIFNPAYSRFIVMLPDAKNRMWRGYDDRTWVKKNEMSSSRMGRDDVSVDFFLPPNGTGLSTPNKISQSNTDSEAIGIAISFPLIGFSVSENKSSTSNETIIDLMDFNGDRYPDILGKKKIQFTSPLGGRDSGAIDHQQEGNHLAFGSSKSVNLGGSFSVASTPNSGSAGKGAPSQKTSQSASTTGSLSKAEKAAGTASVGVGLSISPNISTGDNDDDTEHSWLDINGDGLPDKIFKGGKVALNLGYSFAAQEEWGYSTIRKGEGEDFNGGAGLGINIGQLSFSAGFSLSRTDNMATEALQDINGDGLIDIISLNNPLRVKLNTGNGFSNDILLWEDADEIDSGSSTGDSKNFAGTICIPIFPPFVFCKICGSLNYSDGDGVSRDNFQIADIDGDGFPDILRSNDDDNLFVRSSTIGKTNLLKKVNRPFGSYFTLTYDRRGNTYEMPHSQWVMDSLTVYDGFAGDGIDVMNYSFEYEGGKYNRRERDFYGFHTVKTIQLDAGNNNAPFRSIVSTYDDTSFYTKGLLLSEVTLDLTLDTIIGDKYLETKHTYEKIDRLTGDPHPNPALDDAGSVFPRLIKTEKFFYEGLDSAGLQTTFTYTYDDLGNVIQYNDFGDNTPGDLLSAFIEYHNNDPKYIKSIPKSVSITTPQSEIRYREADIDNDGNVTQIRQFLQTGEAAVYDLSYYDNGNLKRITRPSNHNGERLWLEYEYDDQVQTYVTRVTDAYGYTSLSVYEYFFGQLLETTDINDQQTVYTIDERGRISTITGPYELASSQPYTIAFEFDTDAPVPYAKTKHYDPVHDSDIETITFVDGLLRPIQVKKLGSIFVDKNQPDELVMTVSGRVIFDALGREVENYYPITEPLGSGNTTFNNNFDNIPPTKTTYDVLDRMLAVELPDGTSNHSVHEIAEDNTGYTTFKTTQIDGLGARKESYTDLRGRVRAMKANGPNGDIWTSFRYNLLGELLLTTDNAGNETKYTYDWLGRRLTEDSPVSGLTELGYDPVGNMTHKITPNLRAASQSGDSIRYTYEFERLVQIDYPVSYQNMVRFTYGEPGAPFNRAGRIHVQEDASGGQEFFYGPLGETVRNIRTILVSNIRLTTFVSEFRYDTWNRIDSLIYPDGEVVKYHYNRAGKLERMTGEKSSHEYVYIDRLGYDKFEQRTFLRYGNDTETNYDYDPFRRRLTAMDVSDSEDWKFMDNSYTYDAVSNILSISNSMQMQVGSIGGPSTHNFEYDTLYRLIRADGTWSGPVSNHEYSLEMEYSDLGDITRKNQTHHFNGLTQFETTYDHIYQYDNSRPHILTKIDERDYTYDSNGNLTSCIRHNILNNHRYYGWDEENRLEHVWDDGYLSRYTYDASGERAVKSHGGVQMAYENSAPVGMINHLDNFTEYVSPYLIARNLAYTKFYYIEDQRFLSKIGSGYFVSPVPEFNGDYITAGNIDYQERMKLLAEAESLSLPAPPTPGNSPVSTGNLPAYRPGEANHFAYELPRYTNENVPPGFNLYEGEEFEDNVYFFHPDHVGSTSYLTNFNGKLRQHVEYLPFGEILLDEHRTNDPLQPYLFTGKELDMETGLYYFGARYYDPELSIWMSVDPMAEKYPGWSPYNYTLLNPMKLVDPDGGEPLENIFSGPETSGFGKRNLNGNSFHYGIDYKVPVGSPVRAAASGIIKNIKINKNDIKTGYGLYVIISHENGYESLYGHLKEGGVKLKKGEKVNNGEIFAESGDTGKSTGPHGHFEIGKGDILKKENKIDPKTIGDLQEKIDSENIFEKSENNKIMPPQRQDSTPCPSCHTTPEKPQPLLLEKEN